MSKNGKILLSGLLAMTMMGISFNANALKLKEQTSQQVTKAQKDEFLNFFGKDLDRGLVVDEAVVSDLDGDGKLDVIMIMKRTDKNKILQVKNEKTGQSGSIDLNARSLYVFMNEGNDKFRSICYHEIAPKFGGATTNKQSIQGIDFSIKRVNAGLDAEFDVTTLGGSHMSIKYTFKYDKEKDQIRVVRSVDKYQMGPEITTNDFDYITGKRINKTVNTLNPSQNSETVENTAPRVKYLDKPKSK